MSGPSAETNRETWLENLTGEMLLFGLLGRLLFSPLEKGFLQSLLDNEVFSETPFGAENADVQTGLGLLQSWAQANQPVLADAEFDNLRVDMTHLFSGVEKVKAPPWESVHFGKHRLVFQERTSQVRDWYRRYGLEVENPYLEPDDHIGLELAFLAHLAKLGIETLDEAESTPTFEQLLDAQQAFLREHLLSWVFRWKSLVQEHAKTSFYQGLALLTAGAVGHLAVLLGIPTAEEAGR
jgi:TorA maturation chaperone TorD